MACDVRVIPIREFMKTDLTGEIDLNASRELLRELMAACKRENMTGGSKRWPKSWSFITAAGLRIHIWTTQSSPWNLRNRRKAIS